MKKRKICFISLGNLYLTPYFHIYKELVNGDWDIIFWNRHNIDEHIDCASKYCFQYPLKEHDNKFKKIKAYIKFRKFAVNIIKNNNYAFIVLLQTSAAMLLSNELKKNYNNNYIVDIRDYTLERNYLFYKLEEDLLNKSRINVISSKGYLEFLPSAKYLMVHNDFSITNKEMDHFRKRNKNKNKIVIAYIGLIRFHKQNKKFIMQFMNDERFHIKFIGKGADYLKNYCDDLGVKNIELIDSFPPEDTLKYYYDVDIIYNLYGNKTPLLDYALSNKLYYAARLGMPILVCSGTYMEKISVHFKFGYVFNYETRKSNNDLYKYYKSIIWKDFYKECDQFISEVQYENRRFKEEIKNIFNKAFNNKELEGED